MGVNEIQQEISKCEGSIALEQQKLDELRQRITEEVKPFAKSQLNINVEKAVTSNAEHTKELGLEKLSAMKKRLLALLDTSDSLVERIFANDDIWMHVNYSIGDDMYAYGVEQTAKSKMLKGIQAILGEAGKLLIEYGYIKTGGMYQWDNYGHRNFNLVSSEPVNSNLLYHGHLPIPESLKLLLDKYAKEIEPLHKLCVKVLDLQEKLSKQEAADMWNEV